MRPDAEKFLNREPGLLAVVGTNGRDGYPLLVPVWYRWNGEVISVWTLESRTWVDNVLRDPRAGVTVQEESAPQKAVIVRGPAAVETGGPGLEDEIRAISRRYVPEEKLDAYVREWTALRTIVRITPRKVFVWN